MMRRMLIFWVAALMSGAGFAATGDDWGFYYQAEIRNADGKVIVDVDGNPVRSQAVTIKLYETQADATAVWGRSYDIVCDDNGLFNVFVADSTGRDPSVSGQSLETAFRNSYLGEGLFIGLALGASPEIKPRQRIRPVPFASVANVAHELTGNPAVIEGDFVVDGTVLVAPGGLTVTNLQVAGDVSVGGTVTENGKLISDIPIGCIILWTKNDPPTSTWNGTVSTDGMWAICDGNNGTPNLTGRFPLMLGGGYNTLGVKSGDETVVLTAATMPKHMHRYLWDETSRNLYNSLTNKLAVATVEDGYIAASEVFSKKDKLLPGSWYIAWYMGSEWDLWNMRGNLIPGHDGQRWMDFPGPGKRDQDQYSLEESYPAWNTYTGGAGAQANTPASSALGHENMPPYYALYYIMRVDIN